MLASIIDIGSKLIDRFAPDPNVAADMKFKMLQARQDGQLKIEEFKHEEAQGQIEINKIEASSTNAFISGWRPFIGWACGCGFVYQLLLQPIIMGVITHTFPTLDMETLMSLLGAILGLGGYRTIEKLRIKK